MGFGILLFGYFLMYMFSISQVYFFADIIGAVVVLVAFHKLSQYNRYFVGAMWACLGFLALCTVNASALMFELYSPTGSVDFVVDLLKNISSCVMHVFVFLGIKGIAQGAECDKIVSKANRNLKITMGYYTVGFMILVMSMIFQNNEATGYLSLLAYVYYFVCIILNVALFYVCFGTLCPADEDETEVKRSRFEIINKMNDKMDYFEEKRREYREESMRMALEEAEKRASEKSKKKNTQNKHKKKKR